MKKIGITHVVNCAKGTRPGQIDTDASFFKDVAIQYLGLQAKDILTYDISKHFEKAANFIDQALSKGGKKLPTGVCVSTLEIGLLKRWLLKASCVCFVVIMIKMLIIL